MVETIDNAIQLTVLGICSIIAIYKALLSRKKEWAMLAIFFSGFFMGNLYWQLFLQFYGETPTIFYVADLSWYVGDFFLYLMLRTILGPSASIGHKDTSKTQLAIECGIVVFVSGMCIYFMQWGDYISNIIAAILMALIAVRAVRGIFFTTGSTHRRICITALFFVICEYALWIGSCFLEGDSLANPYYWFDGALTVSFLMIVIAASRELRVSE